MNVLALDGALGAFSAAVARDGGSSRRAARAGNVALERGLVLGRGCCSTARTLSRAKSIASRSASGRAALPACASRSRTPKSLAAVWERPLVPISSFDLLEFGCGFDARSDGRRRPSRRHLGALSLAAPRCGAPRAGSPRYWTSLPLDAGRDGTARGRGSAEGRAPRACRTRHHRALVRSRRSTPAAAAAALAACSRAPAAEPARSARRLRRASRRHAAEALGVARHENGARAAGGAARTVFDSHRWQRSDIAAVTRIERASFSTVWPSRCVLQRAEHQQARALFRRTLRRPHRRLRRHLGDPRRFARHDARGRSGVSRTALRRSAAAATHRRGDRTRRGVDDARSAREQHGRAAALSEVRFHDGDDAHRLLQRRQRKRAHHVGRQPARASSTATGCASCARASRQ